MAQLINASIDVSKIDKSKLVKGKKGTYLNITIAVNDNADQYGNTTSISLAQSKEEREAKAPKVYLGNGKTFWSSLALPNVSVNLDNNTASDSLPF